MMPAEWDEMTNDLADDMKYMLETGDDVGLLGAIEALAAERDRFKSLYLAAFNEVDRRVAEEREAIAPLLRAAEAFRTLFLADTDPATLSLEEVDPNELADRYQALFDAESAIRSRCNATGDAGSTPRSTDIGVTASPISQEQGSIAAMRLSENLLRQEFMPCVGVFDDCKRTEMVIRDCATVWTHPDEAVVDLGYDMDTGLLVAIRVYGDHLRAQRSPSDESEGVNKDNWLADELDATAREVIGLDSGNLPIPPLQTGAVGSVPEGWVLVPEEPSVEMLIAAQVADHDHSEFEDWLADTDIIKIYRAMLSAAPQPLPAVGDIERLCAIHHDAYEAEASARGWATNLACRCAWADLPEANKDTMRAAMRVLLAELHREPQPVGGGE